MTFDLSALLAGRPQPMGQAQLATGAVAAPRPAASAARAGRRRDDGPQLLRGTRTVGPLKQDVARGPSSGAGAKLGPAAGIVAKAAAVEVAKAPLMTDMHASDRGETGAAVQRGLGLVAGAKHTPVERRPAGPVRPRTLRALSGAWCARQGGYWGFACRQHGPQSVNRC